MFAPSVLSLHIDNALSLGSEGLWVSFMRSFVCLIFDTVAEKCIYGAAVDIFPACVPIIKKTSV